MNTVPKYQTINPLGPENLLWRITELQKQAATMPKEELLARIAELEKPAHITIAMSRSGDPDPLTPKQQQVRHIIETIDHYTRGSHQTTSTAGGELMNTVRESEIFDPFGPIRTRIKEARAALRKAKIQRIIDSIDGFNFIFTINAVGLGTLGILLIPRMTLLEILPSLAFVYAVIRTTRKFLVQRIR